MTFRPYRLFWATTLLFLIASCNKETAPNGDVPDPPYLKGLVKRVELHNADTVSGNSINYNYVNYFYDSLKRVSKLDFSTFFSAGNAYCEKSVMWLLYANAGASLPYMVNKHDSLQLFASSNFTLFYEYEHKLKYDIQNRKTGDSLRKGNFITGPINTSFTPYKYFTWTIYNYYAGPGTASLRAFYDLNWNFLAIDNYGDNGGPPDPTSSLQIDSVSTEDSPLYFTTVNNALAYIFSYEHLMFALPWGFSTMGYQPYNFSKKIPKGVTTVYTSSLNFQRYTMHYFFTIEKNNAQVTKINIVSKAYRQDGSFAGTRKGFITISYYQ